MAKKQKLEFFESTTFKVILMIVGAVLTTAVLAFSVITFYKAKNNLLEEAAQYMVWVFILLGITRFITYLKDRSKMSLLRALVLLAINIGLGIMVMFGKYNPYVFSLSAGIFALSIILSRIFKLIERHSTRDIVFNGLVIVFSIALAIGFFQKVETDLIGGIILAECLFIAVCTFIEAFLMTMSQLNLTVFVKIIFKTYALEILFGLLVLMATFSLVLMLEEPTMSFYPDALWYCFAVVTTIGFGDFYATTLIGRLVTVILGMYGIVVVAVITSIIVNFYNETSGKAAAKELREIGKDSKK